jgi:hypothetical protein
MSAPANPTNREAVLPPDRGISGVDPRFYFDDIAVAGDTRGGARALELLVRTDAQHSGLWSLGLCPRGGDGDGLAGL